MLEREGRRIGYVHVWASVGERSTDALKEALDSVRGEKDEDHEHKREAATTPALDGVIIDMRGKIGGTGQNAGRYLDVIDPRGPPHAIAQQGRQGAGAQRAQGTHGSIDRSPHAQHRRSCSCIPTSANGRAR